MISDDKNITFGGDHENLTVSMVFKGMISRLVQLHSKFLMPILKIVAILFCDVK